MILILVFLSAFIIHIICLFVAFIFQKKEQIDRSDYSKSNCVRVYYFNNKKCKK